MAIAIAQRDDPITWSEACDIIKTNTLERFKRSPSTAAEYRKFKEYLKANSISSTALLLGVDLKWAKLDSNHQIVETYIKAKSTKLLNDPEDIRIVENKFPYYFEPDVSHLLVWTKVVVESDPDSDKGDMSIYTKKLIDKYICKTFVDKLGIPRGNILWFRNWHALQSIRELSHIHVLIKGLTPEEKEGLICTPGVPLTEEDYIEIENHS